MTGAMRPSTATSADGPMNLYQSIALAANEQAKGKGVMVVFSDGIYGGRDVQKSAPVRQMLLTLKTLAEWDIW